MTIRADRLSEWLQRADGCRTISQKQAIALEIHRDFTLPEGLRVAAKRA